MSDAEEQGRQRRIQARRIGVENLAKEQSKEARERELSEERDFQAACSPLGWVVRTDGQFLIGGASERDA